MSGVRDELWRVLSTPPNNMTHAGAWSKTDAILERFDVTPKPGIYLSHLGMIVEESHSYGALSFEAQGKRMLCALESRGLKIVRVEDAQ
jgi:hypothetical protein